MIGAILGGANPFEVATMECIGQRVGVAFQIQDDILDVVGDEAELGKPIGSDAKNNKQTYVTLNGLEASAAKVKELSEEAMAIIDLVDGDGTFLKELITSLIYRTK